jgi:hypothetical protein
MFIQLIHIVEATEEKLYTSGETFVTGVHKSMNI